VIDDAAEPAPFAARKPTFGVRRPADVVPRAVKDVPFVDDHARYVVPTFSIRSQTCVFWAKLKPDAT
jgi:hypothetical protein